MTEASVAVLAELVGGRLIGDGERLAPPLRRRRLRGARCCSGDGDSRSATHVRRRSTVSGASGVARASGRGLSAAACAASSRASAAASRAKKSVSAARHCSRVHGSGDGTRVRGRSSPRVRLELRERGLCMELILIGAPWR